MLATTGQPLRPIRRVDVERRAAWKHPLRAPAGERRPRRTRDGNTVNTSTAARFLGIGVGRTRKLAAEGVILAVKDASGKFRFRLDHLELTANAWRTAEESDRQ